MFQFNPFFPFALLAALFTGSIAAWLSRRARVHAVRALVALAICLTVDLIGLSLDLSAATLSLKRVGVGLQYLGFAWIPVCALRFATLWSGRNLRPVTLWLASVPGALVLLGWLTNDLHHAIEVSNALSPREGFVMRATVAGWGFWVFAAYAYVLIGACAVIYGLEALSGSPLARRQGRMLLAGTFIPWVGNALFLTGHAPDPALDLGAFGYALAVGTWAVALVRQRLLDLVPAARNLAFEQLLEPGVVVDGEGRIIDANRRFLALADAPAGDLVGHLLAERFPLPAQGEWKQGAKTWLVQRSPVGLLGGARAEVILLHDVTERIEAEEARARAAHEATLLARARADFLARMSHEVRTPLYGMLGSTELALGATLPPDVRELLTAVQRSGSSLVEIVDEILDFSRLEAGRVRLETTRAVDLVELATDLRTVFDAIARGKGLSMRTELDVAEPVVALDGARLRQVLTNLVSNAVKFTERGEVVLSVRVTPAEDGALAVTLSVRDTGIGMDPAVLGTIFEPFAQADASISRRFGGSGLGLTIAQRLVQLMNGLLHVESTPGVGSCFRVELRAERAPSVVPPPVVVPKAGLRGGRVLVVDDHPVTRSVSRAMLEREGCLVQTAATGEDALAECARHEFALVLLDLRLPDLDGGAVLERLRATGNQTPVVWFTADALESGKLEARAQGILRKPFRSEDLRAMLDRFMPRAAPLRLGPELTAAFAASSARELAQLEEALGRGDESESSRLRHALQGSAAIIGARELAALCALPLTELRAAMPRLHDARRADLHRLSSGSAS